MPFSRPRLFSRQPNSRNAEAKRRFRQTLRCEALEDRRLLAADTWELSFESGGTPVLATDAAGDAIYARVVDDSIRIGKLSASGQELWDVDFPIQSPGSLSSIRAVEVAPNGDILIGGQYEGSIDFDPGAGQYELATNGFDGFVASFQVIGSSLDLNWAHLVGDDVRDFAVDSTGDVHAAGTFEQTIEFDAVPIAPSATGMRGSFLASLDSLDGSLDWARQIESQGVFFPRDIELGEAGEIYLGGENNSDGSNNPSYPDLVVDGQLVFAGDSRDGLLLNFSSNSTPPTLDWSYKFGESEFPERIRNIRASSDGSVYIAAATLGAGTFQFAGTEVVTAGYENATVLGKISTDNGVPTTEWVRVFQPYDTPESTTAFLWNMDLHEDAQGNVSTYLVGFFTGTIDLDPGPGFFDLTTRSPEPQGASVYDTGADSFVVKLDEAGELQRAWQIAYSARFLTVGQDESLFVSGRQFGTSVPGVTQNLDAQTDVYLLGLNAQQPTVVFAPPSEMTVSDSITIDADAFDLNNADIAGSIQWSDGSGAVLGSGGVVTLSGLAEGTHTITATATDAAGRTGSFIFDLQVNAEPISIPDQGTLVVSKTIGAAEAVVIDDVNVTVDIAHARQDNLDLFLVAPDGTRVELFTDVGGRSGPGFLDTTLDSDAAQTITTGSGRFNGSYRPEGDLSVLNHMNSEGTWSLEITDDRRRDVGQLNWWSLDISGAPLVPNDPPQIDSTPVTTATQDAPFSYDVDASDPDAGSTLVYSLDVSPSGMTIDATTGVITWTPGSSQIGQQSVTVRVQDQFGAADTQTFVINVANVNDAPQAFDDSYQVDQDTPLNVAAAGLLANDADIDGDALTVVQSTQPTNGTVVANSDGSFSYTPNAGFVGTDTFTYEVTDGVLTDIAAVTLEVSATSADEALYVYDIRFESKRGNKDWRAVFEIRSDSNDNGLGDSGDNAVAGVAITVTFAGNTYSGVTDSNGVFRTSWIRNLSSDSYYANVDSLLASGFVWDPMGELNREDDTDGDGQPDSLLVV